MGENADFTPTPDLLPAPGLVIAFLEGVLPRWRHRIGLVLPGEDGATVLPDGFWPQLCRATRDAVRTPAECYRCQLDAVERAYTLGEPLLHRCSMSLVTLAVPMSVCGAPLACLLCGPIRERRSRIDARSLKELAHSVSANASYTDLLKALWQSTPTLPPEDLQRTLTEAAGLKDHLEALAAAKLEFVRTTRLANARETLLPLLAPLSDLEAFWSTFTDLLGCVRHGAAATFVIACFETGAEADTQPEFAVKAVLGLDGSDLRDKYALSEIMAPLVQAGEPTPFRLDEAASDPLVADIAAATRTQKNPVSWLAVAPLRRPGAPRSPGFLLAGFAPPATGPIVAMRGQTAADLAGQIAMAYEACLERERSRCERMRYVEDVTHMLRAPTQGIRGHALNLLSGRLSVEKGRLRLEDLANLALMVSRYAENFRLATQIRDTGRLEGVAPTLVTSADLVKSLIRWARILQGVARMDDVRVEVDELSFRGCPPVLLDKVLFEQALLNILENAVKYSYEGAVVVVSATPGTALLDLSVTNDGIQLKPEYLDLVYHRDWRSPEAKAKVPSGTGIGLFIARAIILGHQGAIVALPSTPAMMGFRTTFTVSLPAAKSTR